MGLGTFRVEVVPVWHSCHFALRLYQNALAINNT